MAVPDVLGLPVEEARARLAEAGYADVVEATTAPPRGAGTEGTVRVVRQRGSGERIELVVARFPVLKPSPQVIVDA